LPVAFILYGHGTYTVCVYRTKQILENNDVSNGFVVYCFYLGLF